MIQQYLTLFLSSLINTIKIKFNNEFSGTIADSITCLVVLIICFTLPFIYYLIISNNIDYLDSNIFKNKYGTLIESFKTNNKW